jgi:hypothetical protein
MLFLVEYFGYCDVTAAFRIPGMPGGRFADRLKSFVYLAHIAFLLCG